MIIMLISESFILGLKNIYSLNLHTKVKKAKDKNKGFRSSFKLILKYSKNQSFPKTIFYNKILYHLENSNYVCMHIISAEVSSI